MADPNTLEGSLANIPGLTEYLAMRRYMGDQRQREQAQGQQQQFIQDRAALGENPTQEQLMGVASRYADPTTLLHYGQASQDRKDALAARLQQSHELAQYRLDNLERQKEADLARVKNQESRQALDDWYKRQTADLKKYQIDSANELKKMGIDIAQQRADQTAQGKTDKSVQQLGTALERANLPEADATLRAAEDAIQKNPDAAKYIAGPMSLFPDAALPKNVTDARQAFTKVFNITLKNRSGAAVTPPEFERLKQEFATGAWKKPEQLIEGLNQARNIIAKHYQAVAAGYGTDALNSYNENLRQTGGTPLLEPQGAVPPGVPGAAPATTAKPKRLKFDSRGNLIP